jgi:hypothetical protein
MDHKKVASIVAKLFLSGDLSIIWMKKNRGHPLTFLKYTKIMDDPIFVIIQSSGQLKAAADLSGKGVGESVRLGNLFLWLLEPSNLRTNNWPC